MNNKIYHLHERCLRMYNDITSSFKKLLEIDRSLPILYQFTDPCNRDFQRKDLAPIIFSEIF